MRDEPPPNSSPSPELDPDSYSEPAFNFRHGLKVLLIIGVIITIISAICIAIDGRYG
jgi:hypothetical protein